MSPILIKAAEGTNEGEMRAVHAHRVELKYAKVVRNELMTEIALVLILNTDKVQLNVLHVIYGNQASALAMRSTDRQWTHCANMTTLRQAYCLLMTSRDVVRSDF